MNPRPDHDRWTEIDALFEAALERAPEERRAFVLRACGDDEALRDAVLELLAASEEAAGFLESQDSAAAPGSPLAGLAAEMIDETGLSGRRVGAYRIVRPIARGGMGTVYLAERADGQFEKRVALKVLRRGLDTVDVLRRFRAERQILASLTHPNIARLLDGGETPDGRPYLVMEYVEGRPIDRYADEERLTLDERLRLFGMVARAVRSAHRSLVVHRDLKPGNILVRDDGTVKLLDFGIAKLLDDADGPRTRTGMWMMTPEYASPEQVRGEPITTASDVYQLGLLLYELLSGSRAYEVRGRSPAEVEREVCGRQPAPMSATVERRGVDAGGAREAARARSTTPDRLRRRLRGDLDAIAAKALRREPGERYPSVERLLEDLERAADGRPVRARRGSRAYRVRRFLGRNRLAVASAASIVALLAAFGGLSLRYALNTADHARLLAAERDRARLEARKAEEVKELLAGLFREAGPRRALGREVTVREALERGLPALEAELADQPEVRASLLGTIGNVYRNLGEDELAESVLRRAIGIWREGGGDRPELAAALNSLALLLIDDGRHEEAEALLREALPMQERLFGRRHDETASSMNNLAIVLSRTGERDEALALYREAIGIRREVLGERHPRVATAMSNLGSLLTTQGETEEAEAMFREALSIREEALPATHPHVAVSLVTLGRFLRSRGDYDEAESLLRRALAIDREVYGPDHREVAKDLINLGYLLRDRGRYAEAEPLLREALAIARSHPEEGSLFGDAANMLALTLSDRGEYAEAERLHRAVLETKRELYGDASPTVAVTLYNLATVQQGLGRHGEAVSSLRRVAEIDSAAYGAEHREVGVDLTKLADALAAAGRPDEAGETYRRALRILRAALPSDHPRVANAVLGLGGLLLERGDAGRAVPLLREGLRIRTETLGEENGLTAVAQSLLGAALAVEGASEEGRALLERGHAGTRAAWGDDDRRTRAALRRLSELPPP